MTETRLLSGFRCAALERAGTLPPQPLLMISAPASPTGVPGGVPRLRRPTPTAAPAAPARTRHLFARPAWVDLAGDKLCYHLGILSLNKDCE